MSTNSVAQHTPGDWRLNHQVETIRVETEGGTGIADVWPLPDEGSGEANAALIRAAPEMFDALKAFLFSFDETKSLEGYEAALTQLCKAKRHARLIIAQASIEAKNA